jgi:hypothetical protein
MWGANLGPHTSTESSQVLTTGTELLNEIKWEGPPTPNTASSSPVALTGLRTHIYTTGKNAVNVTTNWTWTWSHTWDGKVLTTDLLDNVRWEAPFTPDTACSRPEAQPNIKEEEISKKFSWQPESRLEPQTWQREWEGAYHRDRSAERGEVRRALHSQDGL